ncbi:hypothetical protein TeGR_g5455 [Tetraparma gracilis]|uniref:Uncharacterized protein n=1 Tax=Tetraparma gracilis TaxID=2962635 RepID=A0ABQ6MDC1_9STRA|nr:hypothetical protein TeGR_g5455 [Tetraparma gracilis]
MHVNSLLFAVLIFALACLHAYAEEEVGGRILNPGIGMLPGDGKTAKWPEVVGMGGIEAAEAIQKSRPDLKIVTVLPEGSPVTRDMRFDRVRVFVDDMDRVSRPPRIG